MIQEKHRPFMSIFHRQRYTMPVHILHPKRYTITMEKIWTSTELPMVPKSRVPLRSNSMFTHRAQVTQERQAFKK